MEKKPWWGLDHPDLETLRQYLNYLAGQLGIEIRTWLETEDTDYPVLTVEGYLSLYQEEHTLKELGILVGNLASKVTAYVLERIVYDPGVRYYKDGSGQPPTEDYVPVATFASAANACRKIMQMVLEQRLDNAMTADGENEEYYFYKELDHE